MTTPSNSAAVTSTTALHASTGSTLTIASMPSTLMLGVGKHDETGLASLSAANTPIAPPTVKHCTFALTPVIIPPPNNKISFLAKARFHANTRSPSVPTSHSSTAADAAAAVSAAAALATTSSAPSLIEEQPEKQPLTMRAQRTLEHCQSLQSQITTIDDIDTDLEGLGLDRD